MGSLYTQLGECVRNFVRAVELYDVVTHVDSNFFQVFLGEVPLARTRTYGVQHNSYERNNTGRWLEGIEGLEHT